MYGFFSQQQQKNKSFKNIAFSKYTTKSHLG